MAVFNCFFLSVLSYIKFYDKEMIFFCSIGIEGQFSAVSSHVVQNCISPNWFTLEQFTFIKMCSFQMLSGCDSQNR